MKYVVALFLAVVLEGNALIQPITSGGSAADSNSQFATSAASGHEGPARAPNYRNAWDDCGGAGASATERMRSIAAKIKGWAKPIKFVRNAAQDCGKVAKSGTQPGPGEQVVYPGPEIHKSMREGLRKAAGTLAKYPAGK